MGKIQNALQAANQLNVEERQIFLRAMGVSQHSDPAIRQDEQNIDGYELWEAQLTPQQYQLCVTYLQNGLHATNAARIAGYNRYKAYDLLNNHAGCHQFVRNHISKLAMDAPEALFHLANLLRLQKGSAFNPETGELSLKLALQSGVIELVKSYKKDDKGIQVGFEEKAPYFNILTKCLGMQKDINIRQDIGTVAREAGMDEAAVKKHEAYIEAESQKLAEDLAQRIRKGEPVNVTVVGE